MITATDTVENRKRRATLHAILRNMAGLKDARNKKDKNGAYDLEEVAEFKRPEPYLRKFEQNLADAAKGYNDCFNTIPNELRNTCQDRELKDQWEVAFSIKGGLIQEFQNTRQHLKRTEQDLDSLKSRIKEQRGEPAIVKTGESLPWEEGVIARTFSKIQVALGHVEVATWASQRMDRTSHSLPESMRAMQSFTANNGSTFSVLYEWQRRRTMRPKSD